MLFVSLHRKNFVSSPLPAHATDDRPPRSTPDGSHTQPELLTLCAITSHSTPHPVYCVVIFGGVFRLISRALRRPALLHFPEPRYIFTSKREEQTTKCLCLCVGAAFSPTWMPFREDRWSHFLSLHFSSSSFSNYHREYQPKWEERQTERPHTRTHTYICVLQRALSTRLSFQSCGSSVSSISWLSPLRPSHLPPLILLRGNPSTPVLLCLHPPWWGEIWKHCTLVTYNSRLCQGKKTQISSAPGREDKQWQRVTVSLWVLKLFQLQHVSHVQKQGCF